MRWRHFQAMDPGAATMLARRQKRNARNRQQCYFAIQIWPSRIQIVRKQLLI